MEQKAVLRDSLYATLAPVSQTGKKPPRPVSLMFYNYDKSDTRIATTDSLGGFWIKPEYLAMGPRFFVRYFPDKENMAYKFRIPDAFDELRTLEARYKWTYILGERLAGDIKGAADTTDLLQYGKVLDGVVVKAKGRGFSDRYLGYLDSIAKFEGNTDYVGTCGWLNCPSDHTDIKPIEGKEYHVFSSDVTNHNKVVLTNDNHKTVIYHYPKYTEEELLVKFNMAVAKGYYQSRQFYEIEHVKDKDGAMPDERNTLLWKPVIVTDKNGEATIEFFCSDIRSRFIGLIEGTDGEGAFGTASFYFNVR